jgi:hypothetical protein
VHSEVLVVFGDDFDPLSSERFIQEWSRSADRSPMILVTSREALAESVRHDPRASVHRRPLWGSALLAAVRSVAGAGGGGGEGGEGGTSLDLKR